MLVNFRTYQLAVQLYHKCEDLQVKHHLKDQLLRASLSVALNLAEGSAKRSRKDQHRFYEIAYASNREVQAILGILREQKLLEQADQIGAMIYKLKK